MSHGRIECSNCKAVLMSCRCPEAHQVTYVSACDKCKNQMTQPSLCQMCKGTQIISLEPGNILAPCLECAADKSLGEIVAKHQKAERAENLAKERRMIENHNRLMKWLDV